MRIDVLGVGFDNLTLEEAVEAGMDLVRAPGAHYVVTPNPEIVEVCREDPAVMDIVNRADLVLADGIGVIKGAAMLGTPLKGKVPGIEFAAGLLGKLAKEGRSVYLLGAKPGVAELAGKRLSGQYPGLKIAGTHDGYFQEDAPVVEDIRAQTWCWCAWERPSRKSGWRKTAPIPEPICSAAWAEAWTYLPAWWNGHLSSGVTMVWNGSIAF